MVYTGMEKLSKHVDMSGRKEQAVLFMYVYGAVCDIYVYIVKPAHTCTY